MELQSQSDLVLTLVLTKGEVLYALSVITVIVDCLIVFTLIAVISQMQKRYLVLIFDMLRLRLSERLLRRVG
jgi:hypothetical protein